MAPLVTKAQLRCELKSRRAAIKQPRRTAAALALCATLRSSLPMGGGIASFHSLPQEIDMGPLNQYLEEQGRFILPRISDMEGLQFFWVEEAAQELQLGPWGLWQPDPTRCKQASGEEIALILVPGLGFDRRGQRLGYGRGHYDRFLTRHLALARWGVGFVEQEVELLPCEAHDVAMHQLVLV